MTESRYSTKNFGFTKWSELIKVYPDKFDYVQYMNKQYGTQDAAYRPMGACKAKNNVKPMSKNTIGKDCIGNIVFLKVDKHEKRYFTLESRDRRVNAFEFDNPNFDEFKIGDKVTYNIKKNRSGFSVAYNLRK